MMINNKIFGTINFIIIFFIIHPPYQLCSDKCLLYALVCSIASVFLNINILDFFRGNSVDMPGYALFSDAKSSKECKNNYDKFYRIVALLINVIFSIVVIFVAILQSWIFN